MKFKTKLFNTFRSLVRITNLDTVLHKFTKDRKTDSFISKLVPNNYQYKGGTIRKVTSGGIHFEVDIHDYIGHYLYFGFEDLSQVNLFNLCKHGDVVIDIGSNIGFSLLNMAKLVGKDGRIFGFEPDPLNYSRLQKNISLNNFSNVKTYCKGLGDKPGNQKLENRVEHNSGGKRIVSANTSPASEFSEVEIDTLDNFVSKNSISKVDLIKIDVEGYEMNVLKGALATLQKHHPILFIEIDDNNLRDQSSSAKELITFLSSTGYSIVHAETKSKITEETEFANCHYDIICKKK